VHLDFWVIVAGMIGGFTVGLTGMGGGALMTPMLVLFFGIQPLAAVASDLVNSLIMKPFGGFVHMRRGTVQWGMVRWLVIGSVPSAFLGVVILQIAGDGVQNTIKLMLGWALLVSCVAMVAKTVLTHRAERHLRDVGRAPNVHPYRIKAVPTLFVGVVGGVIVGMTSVGSGSLMIVMLMLLYPSLSSSSLVGTDLVQAIPLVASAALAHTLFGHVDFGLTGSLIIGSIPGVYIGARLSARAPDAVIRPALALVLLASSLKLLGVSTTFVGWMLAAAVLAGLPLAGAIDATTRSSDDWARAGRRRTRWVAWQAILAPLGAGVFVALVYFTRVRPELDSARTAPVPVGEPA